MGKSKKENRRSFLIKSSMVALGAGSMLSLPRPGLANSITDEADINIIGPKRGYSPHIGTLVSMMSWMRLVVLETVQGMTMDELDYIHDEESNSIGAMLLHLAATERFYQIHCFEGKSWGDWPEADTKLYGAASALGEKGRKTIKGNSLDFYLEKLGSVRETTFQELAKRDDEWLMKVDTDWFWGPTNNYCKWFHVCEHESNHNGQIKYIQARIS